jgi:hypothetical protein
MGTTEAGWASVGHTEPLLGPHVEEREETRLGRGGSFGLCPYSRVKTFSIFQFANYFEFSSNLNFEQLLLAK